MNKECTLGDGRKAKIITSMGLEEAGRQIVIQSMMDGENKIIGVTINRTDLENFERQELLLSELTFSFLIAGLAEFNDQANIGANEILNNYIK